MNDDPLNLPPSRSWRDIPQPVVPRAMSSGGKWRLSLKLARIGAAAVIACGVAWGAWRMSDALRARSPAMPTAVKKIFVKSAELQTSPGGVLDQAWLAKTLELPKKISLMELDLERLRQRVLADGQVLTATLTRQFPDVLKVHVTERTPVARVKVATGGQEFVYLIARDGVLYLGSNYEPTMLETLPWMAGIAVKPDGASFQPVKHMGVAADLLSRAQYDATHIYLNWQIVSLERLEQDREIEVTLKDGSRVVFTTRTDFFPQLAKLDNILQHLRDAERFPTARSARVRIDLSLGREVPVMLEPQTAATQLVSVPSSPVMPVSLAPGFHVFSTSPSKHPREL